MKIAILDPRIQAPGLTKLFPEADYFIINNDGAYDLDKTPYRFNKLYGFDYREDLDELNSLNYDLLFVIYAVHDFKNKRRKDVQYHLKMITKLLDREAFDKVIVFANDDDALDPVKSCPYFTADLWFKRNYQIGISYAPNVFPFPFVMFGLTCPLWRVLTESHGSTDSVDRVIWAGEVGKNKRPRLRNKNYLTRYKLFHRGIKDYVIPIRAPNDIYLYAINSSKFALDMNGRGDPNYRTFELLTTNTLILQQFKYLVWPFEDGDGFSKETIFKTSDEFIEKLQQLRNDQDLYDRALANQHYLKEKYFQVTWLRSYLIRHIHPLAK